MKKNKQSPNKHIKILLLTSLLCCFTMLGEAQLPAAITIEPPDATAYDEVTLIFDPDSACFMDGSLVGLDSIAMHTGVSFITGETWQNVIFFDSYGINGQPTTMWPTGDGRFSITYTPADFYGLTGETVTQICAVFNNGTDWSQDGRDFEPGGTDCTDFFIPLNFNSTGNMIHVPWHYPTIQEGIDASEDGDTVLVALGTYFENIDLKGKAITLTSNFLLDPDPANIENTIIDGGDPTNPDSASVVYFISEEDTTTLLCGFTIRGGTGTYNPPSYSWNEGGGILCHSSPKLQSLVILYNNAWYGAGIMSDSNEPIFDDILIMNNWAEFEGGGIYCAFSNAQFKNMSISYNYAGDGGAIWCIESNIELENILMYQNSASFGGGISGHESQINMDNSIIDLCIGERGGGLYATNTDLICSNSDFLDNGATAHGGAIYYWNEDNEPNSYEIDIYRCNFGYNSAGLATGGILIGSPEDDLSSINISIKESFFTNNLANHRSSLFISGENVTFDVSNTVFENNQANTYVAGASLSYLCQGAFYNCLFNSNDASTLGGYHNSGGASVWSDATVDFINCTFAENTSAYGSALTIGGGGIANSINCIYWGNSNGQIALDTYSDLGGTLTIEYCDIQDGIDSIAVSPESTLNWGDGNLMNNPLFEGSGEHPYALLNESSCINIGNPDTTGLNLPAFDLAGHIRIKGGRIDLGAYENQNINTHIPAVSDGNDFNLSIQPNPFQEKTIISYHLDQDSKCLLEIFDINGQHIATLINEVKSKKRHNYIFDSSGLKPGIYFCVFRTINRIQTRKIIKL